MLTESTYDALSACLDYPPPHLARVARSCATELVDQDGATYAQAAQALEDLALWAESVGPQAAEERYTQLFDLKPVATLNVSHHILGDTYQRGALLSGLAGELNQRGIPHQHDLPDFLPTLLRLLPRLEDIESQRILVHTVVRPGLKKVSDKLAKSPGPYPGLLAAVGPYRGP